MKKIIITIFICMAIGLSIWVYPKLNVYRYEKEVDSLAYSYRIYKSSVCPNKTILKKIKEEYQMTIKPSDISKLLWVNENFDSRFINTCLELNPHRGEY